MTRLSWTRVGLIAGVMALATAQSIVSGSAQNNPPAAKPSASAASAQPAPTPTREQLELQVSILKDYAAELKDNAEKQSAELQAYIKKLRSDLADATASADAALMDAEKSARLRELLYAKEKFDIVVDGYWEQRISNRVALLLVVLMVAAGIAFSALQLWKSVNAVAPPQGTGNGNGGSEQGAPGATAPQGAGAAALAASDLEISAGKIRITSTVVGVVVLVISIAFFYIYMKDLTSIRVVVDTDLEKSAPVK